MTTWAVLLMVWTVLLIIARVRMGKYSKEADKAYDEGLENSSKAIKLMESALKKMEEAKEQQDHTKSLLEECGYLDESEVEEEVKKARLTLLKGGDPDGR